AGENGFGYDPLFYLPDRGCTTAQLPSDAKNQISHRGKAVRNFAVLLKNLLAK
ncbi:MAG: non-canonical purine NTP pyrophosphatase, partial [Planctomycetaceae bacterium]